MQRAPNVHRPVAVTGEIHGLHDTGRNAWAEQLTVPIAVRRIENIACIIARQDLIETAFHRLEGSKVAARGQRTGLVTIIFVRVRVPVALQLMTNEELFDATRMAHRSRHRLSRH